MTDVVKHVGLDVHKETIAVSVAECNGGQVRYFGEITNTAEAIETLGSWEKTARGYRSAMKRVRAVMGCIGNSPTWAGMAWWWRRR